MHPSATVNLFRFLGSRNTSLPIMLEQVTYHFTSYALTLSSREYGSQILIPDFLQVQDTKISLSVNAINFTTLVVNYTGDWVIDTTTISLQATYKRQSQTVDFSARLSSFVINLQRLAKRVVSITLPNALSGTISVSDLTVSGTSTSHGVRFYVTTKSGGTSVYFIYQKDSNSVTAKKAVALEFSNVQFSSVIQDMIGLNLAKIPYFGSTKILRIGLISATSPISDLPSELFTTGSLLHERDSSGARI